MDNDLELTLIACLDALEAGEPIEQILARHPADAAALRPLLEAAVALPALAMAPAPAAQAASRRAFLNQAAAQRPTPRRSLFGLPARLGLALAAMLLAVLLVGGTTFASAAALPGDPLYGLKRSVEQVEVALAGSPAQASRRIEERRRDEVRRLIAAGREEEVRFSGEIEALDRGGLTIGGIAVALGPATEVAGEPRVGARAEVTGRTGGPGVRASELRVEPGPAPLATPAATRTATATATPAPTRTATPRPATPRPATATPAALPPTSTRAPEPSVTPAPSPRPATPTVAATVAPAPTAEPTASPPPPEPSPSPEDNGNDGGGDDNGNDGGGDDNGNDGGGDDNGNDGGGDDDEADDE